MIWATWSRFPLASFTPTMLSISLSLTTVCAERLTTVRAGTLYRMQGRLVLSATALKCWYMPSGVGLL